MIAPGTERVRSGPGLQVDRRLALTAAALVLGLSWFLFLRDVRPVDLSVFLTAGKDVLAGHNPYPAIGSPLLGSNGAFVYPEAIAWLFAPVSAIPSSIVGPLYTAISEAALLLGCWALAGRRLGLPLAVLLSSSALIGVEDGTLNALLFLGLAGAWRLRDRQVVCGLLLAAIVVSKIFLWPVLLWPLLLRRFVAAGTATTVGLGLAWAGWQFGSLGFGGYLRLLNALSGIETPHGKSLESLLLLLGVPATIGTILATLTAVGVIVLTGSLVRSGRAPESAVFGAAIAVSILACPIVWVHYDVLLFAATGVGAHPARRTWALSGLSWIQAAPHSGFPGAHGSSGLHGPQWWGPVVGTAIPVLVTAASIFGRGEDGLRQRTSRETVTSRSLPCCRRASIRRGRSRVRDLFRARS